MEPGSTKDGYKLSRVTSNSSVSRRLLDQTAPTAIRRRTPATTSTMTTTETLAVLLASVETPSAVALVVACVSSDTVAVTPPLSICSGEIDKWAAIELRTASAVGSSDDSPPIIIT
jgi:hypothetical protein